MKGEFVMRVNRKNIDRIVFTGQLTVTISALILILLAVSAFAAVPDAPAIVSAWYGRGGATVNFTPPASNGGSTITGYTVTSSSTSTNIVKTGTGTSSPVVVAGLTNGNAYTFTVTATNSDGVSLPSVPSANVTARPYSPTTGTINNLVVFISFSDQSGGFTRPISYYDGLFNTDNRSLKNFYLQNSYNALTVNSTFYPTQSGSTVVSYQDPHPTGYYQPYNATTNAIGYTGSAWVVRETELVTNALSSVSASIAASGLTLDGDNDGYVDHVTFAICSTTAVPLPVTFNSRAAFDSSGTVKINGIALGSYAFVTADQDFSNPYLAATEIHEMGHNLGYPDLRNNFSRVPVGDWDVMSTAKPVHSGAYLKNKLTGWIATIPEITSYGTYTLNDLTQSTQNSFKIKVPGKNEFLVLEYRKSAGTFESNLPASGLCITRVNEAAGIGGNQNGPPFFLYYFRPGGTVASESSNTNAFTCLSLEGGQTQFNDFSNPACFLSDGTSCGISIYNIGSASGTSITFSVGDPATTSVTHAIKGDVKFSNNSRVSGATVTLSGGATGIVKTTTGTPSYLFTVNEGGNYTVTPTMANMTFTLDPSTVSATVTNVTSDQTLNFIATKITKTISGTVTSAGAPFSDVSVYIGSSNGTCNFTTTNSTLTDVNGNYIFTVYAGSNCDVWAVKTGYNFIPTGTKAFSNITTDQVQNFATNSTALGTSVNPSNPGQSVTLTATVVGNSPTGTVTFNDGVSVLCSSVALAGSLYKQATCQTSSLAVGSHSIVAAYSGDGANLASSSSPLMQIVKTASSTALGSSVNPSYFGQNVTFTATVTGSTPTGTVTFSAGGTGICTAVAVTNSQAQCSISSLTMGNQNIVAVYSGDATNTGSSSSTLIQVVKLPLPTIKATPDTTGTVGLTYAFYISSTDTTSITVSDPVPPGFTVTSTAVPTIWLVNWMPASTGVYSNIILTAHNSDWQTALSPFTVTVKLPVPTIDGRPATIGMVGIPYSTFTPTPCDLTNPHFSTCYAASFSISPASPPGMYFDTTTGVLSGTPTVAGTYSNLVISAINSEGSTAFPAFTLKISPRIDAFTATYSMTTARQYHTATTLPNGKVLVTGGIDVNLYTTLASAELYDPATDSWSFAGSMTDARANHTATLLKNGRVLVAGGYGIGLLNSAEMYDPSDTTGHPWTTVSPMIFGHSSHTATLLTNPDGSVLVMGGFNPDPDNSGGIIMVELYNPSTDSWAAASQMTEWRTGFTATLLPGGKVLVAGGGNTNSAELYDPQNDTWSTTAHPMIANRNSHTATPLANGKVLISGGINNITGNEYSSAELYDPGSGTWSATGALSTVRQSHAATLLADGCVLVTGGFWRNSFLGNAYHDFAELYNPTTEVWSIAGLMTTPRALHSAVLLPNGDVLMAGGSSDYISILASSELYHYYYTVSFTSNGGSAVTNQTVTYSSLTVQPATPTRTGYTFCGWYSDAGLTSLFAFTTAITADATLYAKWSINSYTVGFNSTGGSAVAIQTVTYSSLAVQPATPTRTGYTLAGWYSDAGLTSPFSFTTAITADATLYAKWSINSYTVGFNSTGGSAVAIQTVTYNSLAVQPATPTRTGYTFGGWYSDSGLTVPFDFSTGITSDTMLFAKWTSVIADQTITFPTITAKTYGTADFSPGATTTSALPITCNSDTPAVATITADGLIHITGAGNAVITATQAGNSNYNPATASQTVIVNKAVLTVTAHDISTSAGAVSTLAFTAGYSGFVLGETATVLIGTPAITTTATDSSPIGSYPITPAIGTLAAANYSFNFANGTLAVGLATQSITFNPLPEKTYGTAPIDLTPYTTGGASGNPLTFAVFSGPGSITDSILTVTGVGEIVITASQADTNYYASATAQQAMKINPAVITVTAANATRQTGAANPVFSATYSGFVTGETAATALTGSPSLTTTATTASPQGSYLITAAIGTLTAANYTFTFVNNYLAVGLSSQSITFDSIAAKTYGDVTFALSATATSTLPVTYSSSNTAVATVSGTTVTIVGAGATQISATQAGNNFYAAAIAEQTVAVSPATLTVTAANATRSYATANPMFTAIYNGFVNGDTAAILFGTPTLSSGATTTTPVSSYPVTITANNLSAANYTMTFVAGTLDITKATATVSLGSLSQNYDGTAKSAAATTNPAGLTVTTAYNGATVFPVNVGSYSVNATISDSNYQGSASGTLVINDTTAPTLSLSTLADKAITNNATLNISGSVKDTDSGIKSLTVNGQTVTVASDGTFSTAVTLTTGANTITTIATDNANNQTTDTRSITLDTTAPTLTVKLPADNSKTAQATTTITGTINETSTVTVKVNSGTPQNAAITGSDYSATVTLASDLNTITITATDLANNTTSVVRSVTYDNSNPSLTISNPAQDITTTQSSITVFGTVSDTITTATISITADGQTYTPTVAADGSFSQSITLATDNTYAIVVTATDQAGNTSTVQRNIIKTTISTATGDITGDGTVDIADALKALRIAVGLETATTAQLAVADVAPLSGGKPAPDGIIDIADALVILEKSVGLVGW
jgi:M6 family metalloprotease-like protein/uncharacterized repeat protein (TIGR02543 family)